MVDRSEHGIQRRVSGHHDFRLDGITDLTLRAKGWAVLDVGCNRGLAGYEMAQNGAQLVHGCDNYELGITVAREVFADMRHVAHKFEVLDLTTGVEGFRSTFPPQDYDLVLLLAINHKLVRIMEQTKLDDLLLYFSQHCKRYIGWRGYEEELKHLDELFAINKFKRIQTSYISESISPAAIWRKES